MEEMAKNPPPPPIEEDMPRGKSLVERLCEGDHPVEVALRPGGTVSDFKNAIDNNYVHIKFTDTRGGTVLGVRLDLQGCDFSKADYESATGTVHIEGGLTLDYVKVRCIGDIDLKSLEGKGTSGGCCGKGSRLSGWTCSPTPTISTERISRG